MYIKVHHCFKDKYNLKLQGYYYECEDLRNNLAGINFHSFDIDYETL